MQQIRPYSLNVLGRQTIALKYRDMVQGTLKMIEADQNGELNTETRAIISYLSQPENPS